MTNITLCVFRKKGDDKPLVTYVGNFTFKKYEGRLFVYGADKDCDYYDCAELEQWNDQLWYAYIDN